MSGAVVLQGGGAFVANDDLDAQVLTTVRPASGAVRVVVLPTADAFEHPERLVAAAEAWAERLSPSIGATIEVEGLMVLRRVEANDATAAERIRSAHVVYVVGDQPLHLRAVLKDTPCWDALCDVRRRDATVVGCAGAAAGLCDPMVDPRGGAFTLGLGLVSGVALITQAETWSPERLHRTIAMAGTTALVQLPTGSAIVHDAEGWRQVGSAIVSGELPSQ